MKCSANISGLKRHFLRRYKTCNICLYTTQYIASYNVCIKNKLYQFEQIIGKLCRKGYNTTKLLQFHTKQMAYKVCTTFYPNFYKTVIFQNRSSPNFCAHLRPFNIMPQKQLLKLSNNPQWRGKYLSQTSWPTDHKKGFETVQRPKFLNPNWPQSRTAGTGLIIEATVSAK